MTVAEAIKGAFALSLVVFALFLVFNDPAVRQRPIPGIAPPGPDIDTSCPDGESRAWIIYRNGPKDAGPCEPHAHTSATTERP